MTNQPAGGTNQRAGGTGRRAGGADDDPTGSRIGRRRAAAKDQENPAYAQRRTEIVTAAADLFRRQGVSRTTFADIAAAVGADRASLYYYFGDKSDILDAVITEGVELNVAAAERIRDLDAAPLERLRVLVVDLMMSFFEHYPFLYVYLQENLEHVAPTRREWADRMAALNRRAERAVERIIQDGIDDGSIDPLAPVRVLSFGAMGIVSWTNRWFDPATAPADARTIGEAYAEIIVRGLRRA